MNVLRSVSRYVAEALGEDWEIAWSDDMTFGRPWAKVAASTGVTSNPMGAHDVELRQTVNALAYPLLAVTAEASVMEAERVQRLLLSALTAGVADGWPMRVPLMSYADVPPGQAASHRLGYLRVIEAPSVVTYSDPGDDRAHVVAAEVRLSWVESVRRPDTGEVVQVVGARPAVTP